MSWCHGDGRRWTWEDCGVCGLASCGNTRGPTAVPSRCQHLVLEQFAACSRTAALVEALRRCWRSVILVALGFESPLTLRGLWQIMQVLWFHI